MLESGKKQNSRGTCESCTNKCGFTSSLVEEVMWVKKSPVTSTFKRHCWNRTTGLVLVMVVVGCCQVSERTPLPGPGRTHSPHHRWVSAAWCRLPANKGSGRVRRGCTLHSTKLTDNGWMMVDFGKIKLKCSQSFVHQIMKEWQTDNQIFRKNTGRKIV